MPIIDKLLAVLPYTYGPLPLDDRPKGIARGIRGMVKQDLPDADAYPPIAVLFPRDQTQPTLFRIADREFPGSPLNKMVTACSDYMTATFPVEVRKRILLALVAGTRQGAQADPTLSTEQKLEIDMHLMIGLFQCGAVADFHLQDPTTP